MNAHHFFLPLPVNPTVTECRVGSLLVITIIAVSVAPAADGVYCTMISSPAPPLGSEKVVDPLTIVNSAAPGPLGLATLPTSVVFFISFEILKCLVFLPPGVTSPNCSRPGDTLIWALPTGVGVPVGVAVAVLVAVAVAVAVAVTVGVDDPLDVAVAVGVAVAVAVGVDDPLDVAVAVAVLVAVAVAVGVDDPLDVAVGVGVTLLVVVAVAVGVDDPLDVAVAVGVAVLVAVAVAVPVAVAVEVAVGVAVAVRVGVAVAVAVELAVGVAVGDGTTPSNSKAPISQAVLEPIGSGRGAPRWSVAGH
jgi:hypothetical protein